MHENDAVGFRARGLTTGQANRGGILGNSFGGRIMCSRRTTWRFSQPMLRSGSTVVLVMIFLALFVTLAVSFSAASNMNLRQAHNSQGVQNASLAAESGVQYMLATLQRIVVPPADARSNLLLAVADHLVEQMDGTANLRSGEVTFDGASIHVPPIAVDATGRSFQADISRTAGGNLVLSVRGTYQSFQRGIRMEVKPVPKMSPVFDFGIASKGKISMSGNSTVTGINNAAEANILSATYSQLEAVKMGSNAKVQGDISTSNPDSYVTVSGSASVAGQTRTGSLTDHIHIGVGDVEFPEINPSIYAPFATNVLDRTTDYSKDMTLDNVRIKAGTNPTFAGNATFRGVVYIEHPNVVKFTSSLNITGVIVTEDPGDNVFNTDTISFAGSVNTLGVEELPDEPQFHQLRQMPGTMLLAPGFAVQFHGDFGTLGGTIAADKIVFAGNAKGTVCGGVISYSDVEFTVTSDTTVSIDRSKYKDAPPGFIQPTTFIALANTYGEF